MSLIRIDPSSGSRLMGIEGMRAVAATTILVYHGWLYSDPSGRPTDLGWLSTSVMPHLVLGVTLFFTLSAFLLYRPFAAAIMRDEPLPGVKKYLGNRALRIVPAYWVIFLIVALVLEAALVDPSTDSSGALDSDVLLRNLLLIQGYSPGTLLTGIGPAWSLAVEVVFYLALPLLVLLAWMLARRASTRAGRRLAVLSPALVLLAIGLSGKLVAAFAVTSGSGWDATWNSVIQRSFWGQAHLFTLGILIAVLRVDAEDGMLRVPHWWRTALWISLPLVALPLLISGLPLNVYEALMIVACGILLALVVLPGSRSTASPLLRLLGSRPLVATGVVSYSLFLWHEPLARWLEAHGLTAAGTAGFLLNLVVLGTISWLLAALTYRFVELPALRRKSRRTRTREQGAPVPAHQVQAAP
jgi:peptidoglycan/LPS O-acetylase OafA/YrhL